ncbi:alpha/beta fold hydrolase [Kutzneria albida]|uniref:Alpha/beta hydrolase fold protein n=1 Tax=Kutzneria albida DSM 43870 TaxID=1449976 RepID=W5W0S1_9PSEU|nr:alpha/beta hydrolase [Kutzneria albida]AHH94390.1 alpha/beta hydrolase fold protein [Kutzneria albida DSM 43870]
MTPLQLHQFGPADGKPLLALHGLSGHGARWRRFAAEQLPGHRVIAPDLRGHGRSTALPPWHLGQHVADVLGVLDSLGLDQIPVMGHSYGGTISLHLADSAPERVSRLVLVDPSTGLPPAATREIAESELWPERFDSFEQVRAAQHERWPAATEDLVAEELADNAVQEADGRWRLRYNPAMAVVAWSEMARPAVLPPADLPTLLIRALRADFVQPEFVRACQRRLGDKLALHELDCGHVVYVDRPGELGALVAEFV